MVLTIKKERSSKEEIISMIKIDGRVFILINEETVAWFDNDGTFKFFGEENDPQYEGKWKE